jgi:GxxExxY protein
MNPKAMSPVDRRSPELVERKLSHTIIGCAFEVHREFGYGFSEMVYTRSLAVALLERGIQVQREFPITVVFRGVEVGFHRLDLLVETRVVIEVKTMERLPDLARKQVRKYLLAGRKELGILINFGPRLDFHRILGPRMAIN